FTSCDVPLFCSLFFFSSRRRHTRFSRDWSSDVCSSDLTRARYEQLMASAPSQLDWSRGMSHFTLMTEMYRDRRPLLPHLAVPSRSEERRVGKGSRARMLARHS